MRYSTPQPVLNPLLAMPQSTVGVPGHIYLTYPKNSSKNLATPGSGSKKPLIHFSKLIEGFYLYLTNPFSRHTQQFPYLL